ncbi:uncharacterized protein [Marmota flaviventris]|uniref:uncharacterized protein isoform X2 n=1 Tax=Marmota flaviventris TaxID=93162 RepID=UPI003A8A5E7D
MDRAKNHENNNEKDQDSLNSSTLNSELHEEKENDLLLDEKYFLPSGHPDSPDTQELFRSSVVPSDEPKVSSAVDGAKLNLDASISMKYHVKIEDDALKGSSDNIDGLQEHVLNVATGFCKQKITGRKLWFSKWKIACRSPGLQASVSALNIKAAVALEKKTKYKKFLALNFCIGKNYFIFDAKEQNIKVKKQKKNIIGILKLLLREQFHQENEKTSHIFTIF